ncbi:MAG TPA: DUF5658 family protein [Tepidisphaeraceae bacterium]|jgi:glucan phosphoethanolaminetransferase (alkaline phosphatase superfamily)
MRRLLSFCRFESARTRRAAGLLVALWVLGGIDYLFTVWAQRFTQLEEINPWASGLLNSHHFASLAVSKVLLTGLATVIFWRYRHRVLTQVSLWGLVAIHVVLMVQWSNYTADALQLAQATQMQPDGQVTAINYLPPVSSRPDSFTQSSEASPSGSVDQPAPDAPDRSWQLAAIPLHGHE